MSITTSPGGKSIPKSKRPSAESLRMAIVLVVALAHSLIYVFIVPPWQHYDEPAHFQYAWAVGHGRVIGDTAERAFRREIARSMIANQFYKGMIAPDVNSSDLSLGYAQDTDRQLYYRLAGGVGRLMDSRPVEQQLRAMRLLSVALYLLTIGAACGATRAITQPGSALRWAVPALLALLPSFADLMSAVTDDTLGIFSFSVFLWAACDVAANGITPRRVLFALAATGFAIVSKVTGLLAAPLLGVAVLFALFRNRWRWVPWAVLGMGLVVACVISFRFGDAALWLRETKQSANTQCNTTVCGAPVGDSAFRITSLPSESQAFLFQVVPAKYTNGLRGRTVTLGAWVWACEGDVDGCAPDPGQKFEAESVILRVPATTRNWSIQLAVSSKPEFYVFTVTLPANQPGYALMLTPRAAPLNRPITFFYDGVVMAEGNFASDGAPVFENNDATKGAWGGKPFVNLARNASAEASSPTIRHMVNELATRKANYNPPRAILWSLLDVEGAGWYYALTGDVLLKTFWAKFGWGHVPLQNPFVYDILGLLTAAGVAGGALAALRARKTRAGALVVMAFAMVIFWALTLTRGAYVSLYIAAWIPVARYAFPAILVCAVWLVAGWREWFRLPLPFLSAFKRHNYFVAFLTFLLFFGALAVYGMFSVVTFYAR